MNTALPSWLDETPITSEETPDITNVKLVRFPRTKDQLTLQELVFDNLFERLLDDTVRGLSIDEVVDADPRGVELAPFLRWIRKDKERVARLKEAKSLRSEVMMSKVVKIASGENSINDHNRDRLYVDAMFKLASHDNPEDYGNSKNMAPLVAGGGITINLGVVESPYAKPTIDITPTATDQTAVAAQELPTITLESK